MGLSSLNSFSINEPTSLRLRIMTYMVGESKKILKISTSSHLLRCAHIIMTYVIPIGWTKGLEEVRI
jgi:hypothetical protein